MKYKIKKQWPGGPKIRTIVELIHPLTAQQGIILYYKGHGLGKHNIEEYFEKVKEKSMSFDELMKKQNIDTQKEWAKSYIDMPEEFKALFKLRKLRNEWREGWVPNNDQDEYYIRANHKPNGFTDQNRNTWGLSFSNKDIRNKFEVAFKGLIEKITPLYFD